MIALLSAAAALATPSAPLPLRIEGTKILDPHNREVILRGVNAACLEWSSDGEGHILKTVEVAIRDWKVNHIRFPLSQDRWFGKAPEQKDGGASYRKLVRACVDRCSRAGVYAMLDLHWNNAGEWGKHIGQHQMPDMLSQRFWTDVARTYKNHPAVIFDLYNEPHSVTWDLWLNGGEVDERTGPGARQGPFMPVKYRTPGFRALLQAVRATGARNVVVVGGLDWSYDMSGFLKGYALADPHGNGILYANHCYPFKGDTVETWMRKIAAASAKLPIVVSEFGAEEKGSNPGQTPEEWIAVVLDTMERLRLSWTAWDLHPAAGPTLISDWNYTPTPFGKLVLQALQKSP
jgi:endoglucanase